MLLVILMMKIILLHKLLLNITYFSKLRKAFANGSSANINLSKTQLQQIGKKGGFLCTFKTIIKNRIAFPEKCT